MTSKKKISKAMVVSGQTLNPEDWLENYGNYLYRYALFRLRNPELAEEKVQETFVGALQTRERFRGQASEKTWLTSILRRKIFDHFRKSRRECTCDNIIFERISWDSLYDRKEQWRAGPNKWYLQPDKAQRQREFFDVLHRCLSEIPDRLAQVFILREVDGHKGEDICALMGISKNNLGVMLYRARLRLRRLMETEW